MSSTYLKKSYIYIIRSPNTSKVYIGSTTRSVQRRFQEHKSQYKMYINGRFNFVTSFHIIQAGDPYINILETIPPDNELFASHQHPHPIGTTCLRYIESKWIAKFKGSVNKKRKYTYTGTVSTH